MTHPAHGPDSKRAMTRILTLIALAAAVAAVALSTVSTERASAATLVGVHDQDFADFTTPFFRQARWKRVRYIARWDVALRRADRDYLTRYLRAARQRRIEVFVTFNHRPGERCPRRPCRLPSVRSYTRAFKAFRRRWGRQVRIIAPWNESNHRSQPTFSNPRRAAQFYNVVRRHCRGCKIVAADVIDEANMVRWLRVFRRHARRPRIWGLHNYKDTNPRRGQKYGGTRRLLRAVRGQVWLTETGGIVYFKLPNGRTLFPRSERRASRALRRMFGLGRRYRRRIKRIYIYDWQQPADQNRFDSGLIRANGSVRPGFRTVKRFLGTRQFNP